jgi:hypothetical protein
MFAALFLSHFLMWTDVPVEDKLLARRAPECAGVAKQSENIWDAAKKPAIRLHCTRLKEAYTLFGFDSFASAMDRASLADSLSRGHAGPLVVRGAALERCFLTQSACNVTDFTLAEFPKKAVESFEAAIKIDPRALDDAQVGFDYAMALQGAGRSADSKQFLTSLAQRVTGVLGVCAPAENCETLVAYYLALGAQDLGGGPSSLDDALGAFREARRVAMLVAPVDRESSIEQKRLRALAKAFDLLALDRKGALNDDQIKEAEADAKVLEQAVGAQSRWRLYFADPNELSAARAIVADRSQHKTALDLWRAYVQGAPSGAWAAHAKAHITALEKLK